MNQSQPDTDDLEVEMLDLVDACLSERATDSQLDRLSRLVAENATARKLYKECIEDAARLLTWSAAMQDAALMPPAESIGLLPKSPVVGFLGGVAHALQRPVIWSILACGVLFAVYVSAISWNMLGREPVDGRSQIAAGDSDVHSPDSNLPTDSVATISASDAAEWSQDSEITPSNPRPRPGAKWPNPGSKIASGQSLSLQTGLVELRLKQGTTLIVEGPAEWTVDGENNATLKRGKLVAKVPSQAVGFTLQTPAARIVDLGTEFGAEVSPTGAAQVTVLQGSVQIASTGSRNATRRQKLRAGEAATVLVGADPVSVPFRPENFSSAIVKRPKTPAVVDSEYAKAVLADKPLAYWRFERVVQDQVLDETGNGHHAALSGSVRLVGGRERLGNAAEFHGREDFAYVADHPRLRPTSAMTIEFWLRQAKLSPLPSPIVGKGFKHGGWAVAVADATATYAPYKPGIPGFAINSVHGALHSTNVVDDQWHHIVGVCDGKHMWTVVDGVASEPLPITKPIDAREAPLTIGVGIGFPGWVGTVDEVAIYDKAISTDALRRRCSIK